MIYLIPTPTMFVSGSWGGDGRWSGGRVKDVRNELMIRVKMDFPMII